MFDAPGWPPDNLYNRRTLKLNAHGAQTSLAVDPGRVVILLEPSDSQLGALDELLIILLRREHCWQVKVRVLFGLGVLGATIINSRLVEMRFLCATE